MFLAFLTPNPRQTCDYRRKALAMEWISGYPSCLFSISTAAVAQWIEYRPPKPRVVGSIPASRATQRNTKPPNVMGTITSPFGKVMRPNPSGKDMRPLYFGSSPRTFRFHPLRRCWRLPIFSARSRPPRTELRLKPLLILLGMSFSAH